MQSRLSRPPPRLARHVAPRSPAPSATTAAAVLLSSCCCSQPHHPRLLPLTAAPGCICMGGDGRADDASEEEGSRERGVEECDDDEEEDGFEFGGAEDAVRCVEMAGRSAARAHDYVALAARKRKALAEEEHTHREESYKRPRHGDLSEAEAATMFDQLMEGFGLRHKRRSKEAKKRGRKKGTKNMCSPEVTRMLGDATLLFAESKFKEAIPILHEIVRIVPNLPNSYYLLGSIYDEIGELDKAINFLMLAAYVSPKDASLWKKLGGLARVCHQFYGDEFVSFRDSCLSLQMYRDCGQIDKAIDLLEEYVSTRSTNMDWSLLDLLISLYLRDNAISEALKHMEKAQLLLGSEHKLPVQLQAKIVICHAYLGDMKHAKVFLENVHLEPSKDNIDLIKELAVTFENMGPYEYAVKFYLMIENVAGHNDCSSYVKIAQCYIILGVKWEAVPYFYKALQSMPDNIDIRITLSLLLSDEDKTDEAVALLSPPKSSEFQSYNTPNQQKPWWHDGKVKMQLAKIYYNKGKLEKFVDTIFLTILETLNIEHENRKTNGK